MTIFLSELPSNRLMGIFSCSSCNKPIKTILHRCGFEDPLTCQLYDTSETEGVAGRCHALGGRPEDSLFEDDSRCPIGEDGLSGIPGENGHYTRGVPL